MTSAVYANAAKAGALLASCLLLTIANAFDAPPADVSAGQRLYELGIGPMGEPVRAESAGGVDMRGGRAACALCHRRSGLGAREGPIVVPAVTAAYLFQNERERNADPAMAHVSGLRPLSRPYDDDTLLRLLSEGVRPDGSTANALMPRYRLDEQAGRVLLAYLRQLGRAPDPGVSEVALELATVITPDAAVPEAQAMIEVLRAYAADEIKAARAQLARAPAPGLLLRSAREWNLRIWRLSGEPSQWGMQLERFQREHPAFSLISGIGGDWSIVAAFCDRARLPCLFPNIDWPPEPYDGGYNLYLHAGHRAEVEQLARELLSTTGRVFEIHTHGLREVARSLQLALPPHVIQFNEISDDDGGGGVAAQLARVTATAGEHDALVMWLPPGDLAKLPLEPPRALVLLSGLLAGPAASTLPDRWRERTRVVYPLTGAGDPARESAYLMGWLRGHGLPVSGQPTRVQWQTFVACNLLHTALADMFDAYRRERLIEMLEERSYASWAGGLLRHPSLGPGQRVLSHGAELLNLHR